MAYFTPITDGLDWQAISFINEIIGAYSERRQVVNASAVADYAAGTDIQAASVWSGRGRVTPGCSRYADAAASRGPTSSSTTISRTPRCSAMRALVRRSSSPAEAPNPITQSFAAPSAPPDVDTTS